MEEYAKQVTYNAVAPHLPNNVQPSSEQWTPGQLCF